MPVLRLLADATPQSTLLAASLRKPGRPLDGLSRPTPDPPAGLDGRTRSITTPFPTLKVSGPFRGTSTH